MPFTIKKNFKGEHCVHKQGADGNAVGDSLGCHETKPKAQAQIGAIESKENKGKAEKTVAYMRVETDGDTDSSYSYIPIINNTPLVTSPPEEHIDMSKDTKMHSIDALRNTISSAWDQEYDFHFWVVEIFDEFVVVKDTAQKTHFKVAYTIDDEDVTFVPVNEWEEVKLQKDWVTKALSMKDRVSFEKFIGEDETEVEIDSRFAVKALGQNRIGAYGMLWGDKDHRDVYEEYFTPETKDRTAIFDAMGALPLIVHHAADSEVKTFVYGQVDVMEDDEVGTWWEAKITEHEVYKEYVQPLLDRDKLFSSSGTLPKAGRKNAKTGEITRWPIVEMTTTWMPAEFRMLDRPVGEIKSAYAELGLDYDLTEQGDEEEPKIVKGVEKARLRAIAKLLVSELDLDFS